MTQRQAFKAYLDKSIDNMDVHIETTKDAFQKEKYKAQLEVLSAIEKQFYKSFDENAVEMDDILENINTIMWESYMIRDYPFGRTDGAKIMEELVKWAKL